MVDRDTHSIIQIAVMRVSDDADDAALIAPVDNVFADWVPARPPEICSPLIDEHDVRAGRRVRCGQVGPRQQRRAHRSEVPGSDETALNIPLQLRSPQRIAVVVETSIKWQAIHRSHLGNAWNLAQMICN